MLSLNQGLSSHQGSWVANVDRKGSDVLAKENERCAPDTITGHTMNVRLQQWGPKEEESPVAWRGPTSEAST